MSNVGDTFKTLGISRIVILGAIAAATIVGLFYFTSRLAAPQLSLLFGDLDSSDSAAIISKLEASNIPYEIKGGGSVYVPSTEVSRLRLLMAEDGLPSGGSFGYEIFNDVSAIGTTNFIQNINHLRALEGELARTITNIKVVQGARVHLVLPKRELFSRERVKPTASVILKIPGNRKLNQQKISAIQHLVAAAVPELEPTNVSLVDDKGNLLAKGVEEETMGMQFSKAENLKRDYEKQLAQKIEELLSRTVGFGNVKAQVRADMDFDQITENSEIYDPEGQVARSTQTVTENDMSKQEGSSEVSIANNLPNAGGGGEGSEGVINNTNRSETITNFEISKTTRLHVKEIGEINKLSIAVLVNQKATKAEDGTTTFEPRSKDEMENLTNLVKSAVGYDESRGDQLVVQNMPFVNSFDTTEGLEETNGLMDFNKGDIFKIVELFVLGIVTVLIIFLVIKPIVNQLFSPVQAPETDEHAMLTSQADAGAGAVALEDQTGGGADMEEMALPSTEIDKIIADNQQEGKVISSDVEKVGGLVDQNTAEAATIIRNWINETDKVRG